MVVGGSALLFLRFRRNIPVQLSLRLLLRLYLYVVIVVGLLLLAQGISELVRAGLSAGDKDFSYRPVFVPLPEEARIRTPHPLELKEQRFLTQTEREELAQVIAEREVRLAELRVEQRRKGLDRAQKEGIIEGITLTIVGALVWLAHLVGRARLENAEEAASPINRVYLIAIVIIFGVITLVNLPRGIYEGSQFYLLDPLGDFGRDSTPGDRLGLAIATLPVWLFYLISAIRAVRRGT